jgi:hypothetical protein
MNVTMPSAIWRAARTLIGEARVAHSPRWESIARLQAAGSENSDHLLSGNSGHLPVALPGQKIVGDSISGEGKDDRDAQATRGTGASAGRAYLEGDRRAERRVGADRPAHRRRSRHHDDPENSRNTISAKCSVYVTRPRQVHTVVKKSAATSEPQCARRNTRHDIGRSPLGEMPCSLRIAAIVDRATR